MKKYTAPALKTISAFSQDIIQTSGEISNVPTQVVTGANGETVTATGYGATGFAEAYGINSVTE